MKVNAKNPLPLKIKKKFWRLAEALDPEWKTSSGKINKKDFMRRTLLLCLQEGGKSNIYATASYCFSLDLWPASIIRDVTDGLTHGRMVMKSF